MPRSYRRPNLFFKRLYLNKLQDLENSWISASIFKASDIENLPLEVLLFQSGYITIKDYSTSSRAYQIGYPNREVRESFFKELTFATLPREIN